MATVELKSAISTTSNIANCLLPFRVLGFYEKLSNDLSAYFQTNIAEWHNIPVRYDNDPRSTPDDDIWMEYSIDYGSANIFQLGLSNSRHKGAIVAKIKSQLGVGQAPILDIVDRINTTFINICINKINFAVPQISNVCRIDGKYCITFVMLWQADN